MSYPHDTKVDAATHVVASPSSGAPDPLSHLQAKDKKYKRQIRIVRLASRLTSFVLSAFVIGSLSYALDQYFLTRYRLVPGTTTNQHVWVTPQTLWPTFMLLAIACITFVLNAIMLISYMCGVRSANNTSTVVSGITVAMLIVHVVVWAVAMGLFQMAQQTGSDLWGYSCGNVADEIQTAVMNFLDFGKLCTVQTGAWYSAVLEAINYFLVFVATMLSFVRLKTKRRITGLMEANPDVENGHFEK